MNEIKSWKQDEFNDHNRVITNETKNSICRCENKSDAQWIASRLNLASKLENMTYDYATGKSDGQEIVDLVKNAQLVN